MKLKACLYPFGDDSFELLAALIPEKAREIVSARWYVALDDPVLPKILNDGESTGGFGVSAEAVFSVAELREFSHFEVVCRKFISESKDIEFNKETRKLSPLGELESHNIIIRLNKENTLIGLYGMKGKKTKSSCSPNLSGIGYNPVLFCRFSPGAGRE